MNFDLTEEQEVVRDLAARIFEDSATVERVKSAEASGVHDHALWAALADANLLGLCLPADAGGSEMGMVELALVLEQQGRRVVPLPLSATVLAAMAIADHGTPAQRSELLPPVARGELVLTTALAEHGVNDVLWPSINAAETAGGWRLTGSKPAVPWAQNADRILVPARLADAGDSTGDGSGDGSVVLALVDPSSPGVDLTPVDTTNHEPQAHLALDVLVEPVDLLGGRGHLGGAALGRIFERAVVGLSALTLGVAEESLRLTAEHVSTRVQFGKPLSAFQAVAQRAADSYITCEAMRVTMLNAAWHLAEGYDASADVLVAAYWATEGGQQVVTAGQHLHGGVGADVEHPVHRYFLWGIQLATALGGASSQLARLGWLIAAS